MTSLRELTGKTVKTLREDGLSKVGEKASLYLKRRKEARAEEQYQDGCFRDVLFINGCDENLPHPGRYRVTHQREQLESLGVSTGEVYYQNLQMDAVICYRMFVFFRCPWTDQIGAFVELAKELNRKVFYDVDDLVIDTAYTDLIPYLGTLEEAERDAYDENVRNMRKLLRLCDGAITTTSALARELEQYVPEVYINRNVASEEMVHLSEKALDKMIAAKIHEKAGEISIGYFSGSISHNDDIAMLVPVLGRLLEKYDNLHLVLTGILDFPEELEIYRHRIETCSFISWKELPERMAGVDINIAPLTDNIFNHAKSENKWIEAALVKVPTVASDLGAFREMVDNGVTGILCKNEQQWEEALCALIEQPAYRSLIGQAAWEECTRRCVTAYTGGGLADFLLKQAPPSVAFVIPALQMSGGVMVALQHARILREAGLDAILMTIDEKGSDRWYEFENCRFPVVNLTESRIYGSIDTAVATMWSTANWLDRLPHLAKKKYLVQGYEPDFYPPGDPLRMQARKSYGCSPNLSYVTISKWCQDWLQSEYGHTAAYAPNGLDTDRFRGTVRTLQGRKIRILIEGDSSARYKNVDESFRIAMQLDREKYEIWYMAYRGEPKDWYPVDRFLPQVPYGEVQQVYQECDILLKSSFLEGFSYPPLEMMASGGFVVAVLNDGNREYLEDGVNCLTYPRGDIARAVEAIETICQNNILRQHLYENGLRTAKSRDWENLRGEIMRMYCSDAS